MNNLIIVALTALAATVYLTGCEHQKAKRVKVEIALCSEGRIATLGDVNALIASKDLMAGVCYKISPYSVYRQYNIYFKDINETADYIYVGEEIDGTLRLGGTDRFRYCGSAAEIKKKLCVKDVKTDTRTNDE